MSSKEGQNQDDAMESGKPSESSLTGLLHGFHDADKKSGRTMLSWNLAPVLIASLCLSVVLIVGIYRIGVEGFRLREKVEELAQENTQLEEKLKSVEKEVLYSKREPESAQSLPAKSASEKPRPVRKRTSGKPSKISKIMYRVKDGDSLSQIGERFGVSAEQLCSWNGIEQTDLLEAGQVLIINKEMTTEDLPPEKDYISEAKAIEQIAAVRAEAEAANKAVAQLEGKLDSEVKKSEQGIAMLQEEVQRRKAFEEKLTADYISKQTALEQINEAAAKAEAANKAIAQLEEKLQSERKIRNLTIAMLQEEVQKREALEGKLAADYISKQTALEQINKAAAEAEAANKAIAQVQAKLDSEREEHGQRVVGQEAETEGQKALEKEPTTDYIPKEQAIEQIKEATEKAEAASRAVSELQKKLDAEVKKSEQTIAMLQEEVQERKALEEKLAADYISKRTALEQINEAAAKAEAASTAVVQLQGRVDTERREYEQTVERLEEDLSIVWSDSLSREEDIEQIAALRAEAEAANKAIVQLQEKLDTEVKKSEQTIAILQEEVQKRKALEEKLATDYISKQVALEQISEAEAKAQAASRAVSELHTRLDSERKAHEQTVRRLEEEAEKRKDLEEKPITVKAHASRNAATRRPVSGQATSAGKTDEYRATEVQETSMGKPIKETVHVIREGDNLYRIGIKYGVSWKTLVKFNNLVDANAIYVGQKIRIPRLEKADARSTLLDER
jgi:LysM repeat protein